MDTTNSQSSVGDVHSEAGSSQKENSRMGACPWYMDQKYSRYWKHRSQVTQWFGMNMPTSHNHGNRSGQYGTWCKQMAEYHSSMARWMKQLGLYYSNWYKNWMHYQHQEVIASLPASASSKWRGRGRVGRSQVPASEDTSPKVQSVGKKRKARKSSKSRKKQKLRLSKRLGSFSLPTGSELGDGEQFQMEITEEMMEFFAQSAKHKRERDAKRKVETEQKKPTEEHVNLGEVNAGKNKATTRAPTERPGLKRTSEMRTLYGRGAAMIHGMETAMQLNFNRNCDRQQPKHWPQLPLKIEF